MAEGGKTVQLSVIAEAETAEPLEPFGLMCVGEITKFQINFKLNKKQLLLDCTLNGNWFC